jgi:hypothetical protein
MPPKDAVCDAVALQSVVRWGFSDFLDRAAASAGLLGIELCGSAKPNPRFIAASPPAPVRSRINSRSNSVSPAKTVRTMRPAGEVVSAHGSDKDLSPAPACFSFWCWISRFWSSVDARL